MKGISSFRRFNINREFIPNCWHSCRESMFANMQLSSRNKKFFGNGLSKGSNNIVINKDALWVYYGLQVYGNPCLVCTILKQV